MVVHGGDANDKIEANTEHESWSKYCRLITILLPKAFGSIASNLSNKDTRTSENIIVGSYINVQFK